MKVCILTAGMGSRMGNISQALNKSILPTNGGAIISEIISSFKKNTKFVIPVGYKRQQVKDYISIAHSNILQNISYVEVDNYNKKFSGPGYSLFKCKKYLKEPFYVISCDTILPKKNVFKKDHKKNLIFGKKVKIELSQNYCNLEIKNKTVIKIAEKTKYINKNYYSFSGLSFIKDYKVFWKDLERVINIKKDPQISDGFKTFLKEKKLKYKNISWIDVGKFDDYQKYINKQSSFDFSKKNEAIYIINGKVIKFFEDRNIVDQRYKKSNLVKNIFPKLKKKNNFYFYKFAKGSTLYEIKNQTNIFKNFLIWASRNLWLEKKIDNDFYKNCKNFYKAKTYMRLKDIFKKYKYIDKLVINKKKIYPIKRLLSSIDWSRLFRGLPYFIHGDLQFDNILYVKKNKFLLLDWRHSFGKYINKGDIYYDLAKLLGGILLNYKDIKQRKFSFFEKKNSINYNLKQNNFILKKNYNIFKNFIKKENLDIDKIHTLAGLIYLNMSPLHHYPFDKILFGLAKEILSSKNYFQKYELNK